MAYLRLSQTYLFAGYSHCVKSARIRSFSGPYSPAFGLNTIYSNTNAIPQKFYENLL